jgi:hypothetical protein
MTTMQQVLILGFGFTACAGSPTAPKQEQVIGQVQSIPAPFTFILDTVATGDCCGGSQQYVPYPKPQPKNPAACPIFQSLTCKP